MSTNTAPSPVARTATSHEAESIPAAFAEQLKELAGLVQRSNHLYSSPLGPYFHNARHFPLPRFVYFGANTDDDSPRLSFIAGLDHRDLRGTHALLHLVRLLAVKPDTGHGLYLSFFPLVDVLGLSGSVQNRNLARSDWRLPTAPELDLLGKDSRLHGYHGFIRIESSTDDDVISIQVRGLESLDSSDAGVELLSSEDVAPFTVRWEAAPRGKPQEGPLSLGSDLPQQAFELTLRIPLAWSPELYREATATILKRFILRYRAFLAHAQYL